MKKTVPIVVAGGALLLIASQFLRIEIGLRNPDVPIERQVADKVEDATEAIKEGGQELVQSIVDDKPKGDPKAPENAYVGLSVVDVLIDGDKYWLLTVKDAPSGDVGITADRKEVPKYEVIRLTQELPGDPSGIKVRIQRTSSATAQAESELMSALEGIGIERDAIDYRSKLVEP